MLKILASKELGVENSCLKSQVVCNSCGKKLWKTEWVIQIFSFQVGDDEQITHLPHYLMSTNPVRTMDNSKPWALGIKYYAR